MRIVKLIKKVALWYISYILAFFIFLALIPDMARAIRDFDGALDLNDVGYTRTTTGEGKLGEIGVVLKAR